MPTSRRDRMPGALVFVTLAALLSTSGISAQGDSGSTRSVGFHFGVVVPVERVGNDFGKTVDNTDPNTLVLPPRRGTRVRDESSASAWRAGAGVSAGYRLPLGGSAYYAGGKVDAAVYFGTVDGQLAGVGESPGRNLLGEVWPDRWTFDRKRSYGFTLEIGGSPGSLAAMNTRLYLLGGIRLVQAELTNHFHGCMSPAGCGPSDFASGMDTRDLNHQAFTFGLGMEKGLGGRLALRVEARHTPYCNEQWTANFPEVRVTVPTVLDAGETGLAVGLAWRAGGD